LLNYKLNQNFSVNGGGSFATFQSTVPLGTRISTVNLPAGIDYSTRHFGTGFEYQRTINLEGGGGGNDYAVNARGSAGNFQFSGFYRHDVQVPTLANIFSNIPGLQDALDRLGIVATTPEQLADLLRNTALLQLLGFTNAFTVNLAPARNDINASMTWFPQRQDRRKVDFNFFHSNTELLQGNNFILTTATVSYAQRIKVNNNIILSASVVRTTNNGVTDTHPLFSVSFQRKFYTVPSMLLPGRHGMIEGHVFRDDDSSGRYDRQLPPLAGVEVRLDEDRVARTDSSGYYSFHHVPFGTHRVEAHLQSDEPFFYTTDSPAMVDMNASVDFGVNFAKGQIFGYLLDDSGSGIGGITTELKSDKVTRRISTGGNGKFSFTGLPAGEYSVAPIPDSFPPGYVLQDLAAQTVTVEPGKPASTQFTVRALRSISGRVLVYDKGVLQTVPLEGATVQLRGPSGQVMEARTGANGGYIFRNLPAGVFTVVVEYGGKEASRSVMLTPAPINVREIDLNAGTKDASPKPIGLRDENSVAPLSAAQLAAESRPQPAESSAQPANAGEEEPASRASAHPAAASQPADFCIPLIWIGLDKSPNASPNLPDQSVSIARTNHQARIEVVEASKTNHAATRKAGLVAKASSGPKLKAAATKSVKTTQQRAFGNSATAARPPRPAQKSPTSAMAKSKPSLLPGNLAVASADKRVAPANSAGASAKSSRKTAVAAVTKGRTNQGSKTSITLAGGNGTAKHAVAAHLAKQQPGKLRASSASPSLALRPPSEQPPASMSPAALPANLIHCLSDQQRSPQ